MGVVTARIVEDRGELAGVLMVQPEDEVFAITSAGGVIRTSAAEVKISGRQTMGVRLMNLAPGDSVVAVARNAEAGTGTDAEADGEAGVGTESDGDSAATDPSAETITNTDMGSGPETGESAGEGRTEAQDGDVSAPDATEPGAETS
jgi:hypothetical protein